MSTLKTVRVVEETPEAWNRYVDENEGKYRSFFKNRDQLSMFLGLPVPDSYRLTLLEIMSEDKRVKECWGVKGKDKAHRSKCIICCWRFPNFFYDV